MKDIRAWIQPWKGSRYKTLIMELTHWAKWLILSFQATGSHMVAFCVPASSSLLMTWESSRGGPISLGPCTCVEDLEEAQAPSFGSAKLWPLQSSWEQVSERKIFLSYPSSVCPIIYIYSNYIYIYYVYSNNTYWIHIAKQCKLNSTRRHILDQETLTVFYNTSEKENKTLSDISIL